MFLPLIIMLNIGKRRLVFGYGIVSFKSFVGCAMDWCDGIEWGRYDRFSCTLLINDIYLDGRETNSIEL